MKRPIVVAMAGVLLACGAPPETPGSGKGAPEAEAPAEPAGNPTPSAAPGGFVDLLRAEDGRYHKAGWNHYGPGHFELDPETGVLTSHGGMGLFWYSVRTYSDFVLELEFKCADAQTNSGVFLRVPGVPASDEYIYHAFEVQIDDAGEGIHATGAAYDAEAPTRRASKPAGEWNHYRITFRGSRLQVELNGERVLD